MATAYMMYTFSAWEKRKTSLVLGQTTLSSCRIETRDCKERPGALRRADAAHIAVLVRDPEPTLGTNHLIEGASCK